MAADAPKNVKNGMITNVLPDGNIEVALISKAKSLGSFEINPEMVGSLVSQLMQITMIAHQKTGKPLPLHNDNETEWPWLTVSGLALGPCQMPGHQCLILRFGKGQLGIALENAKLRALGEALIAASVSETGTKN